MSTGWNSRCGLFIGMRRLRQSLLTDLAPGDKTVGCAKSPASYYRQRRRRMAILRTRCASARQIAWAKSRNGVRMRRDFPRRFCPPYEAALRLDVCLTPRHASPTLLRTIDRSGGDAYAENPSPRHQDQGPGETRQI